MEVKTTYGGSNEILMCDEKRFTFEYSGIKYHYVKKYTLPEEAKVLSHGDDRGKIYYYRSETLNYIIKERNLTSEISKANAIKEMYVTKLLSESDVSVPKYYDGFLCGSKAYIFIEFINGIDLITVLNKSKSAKLIERIAYRFCKWIYREISKMHKLGIVHRDIKPENVIIDNKYNLYIIDFEFAYHEDVKCSNIECLCGTMNYLYPKLLSSKYSSLKGEEWKALIRQSDLWSATVTCFVMFSGGLELYESDSRDKIKRYYNMRRLDNYNCIEDEKQIGLFKLIFHSTTIPNVDIILKYVESM